MDSPEEPPERPRRPPPVAEPASGDTPPAPNAAAPDDRRRRSVRPALAGLPGRIRDHLPGRTKPVAAADQVAAGHPALHRPVLRRHRRVLRGRVRVLRRAVHRALAARRLRLPGGTVRWAYRVVAYFHFMTDAYPPFSLADDPDYPVRLNVEYPEQIDNWRPLVQWLLAIPYLIVAGVLYWLTGVLSIVAFFTDPLHEADPARRLRAHGARPALEPARQRLRVFHDGALSAVRLGVAPRRSSRVTHPGNRARRALDGRRDASVALVSAPQHERAHSEHSRVLTGEAPTPSPPTIGRRGSMPLTRFRRLAVAGGGRRGRAAFPRPQPPDGDAVTDWNSYANAAISRPGRQRTPPC